VFKQLAVSTLALGLCAVSALAAPKIETVAPRDSVIVVGLNNLSSVRKRTVNTPMWGMWDSDQFRELISTVMEDAQPEFESMLEELELDEEDFTCPDGNLGLALFVSRDEETEIGFPGVMLFADFADEAKADRTGTVLEALIKKGEEEDEEFKAEVFELAGREGWKIDIPQPDPEEREQFQDDMMGGGMPMNPEDVFGKIKSMYIMRDGNCFYLCTDERALRDAFDAAAGEDIESVGDRDDYQAMMGQVGGGDVYGAVLFTGALDIAGGPQAMGMAGMIVPMVNQYIGDIHGFGMSARVQGENAMFEQTVSVYMPNGKVGLSGLMNTETPRNELPPYITADTSSYTRINFEINGLMGVFRPLLMMFAGELAMAQDGGPSPLDQIDGMLKPLGPEFHIIQTVSRPVSPESIGNLMAISCSDTEAFETAFNGMTQGAIEGRDFQGYRVYTMEEEMVAQMMPDMAPGGESISMAIGSGQMFMGETAAVEQALRALDNKDGAALASEELYQMAVSILPDRPVVGWGYTDVVTGLEATMVKQRAQMEKMIRDLEEIDPEFAEEMRQENMNNPFDSLPLDRGRRLRGDVVHDAVDARAPR
jgi:hypothetical protein